MLKLQHVRAKARKKTWFKLVQAENEEGVEYEVPPDRGGNIMIWRSMVILDK